MSVGSFKTASASTEKILKKKSGDVNDEANFSFFILLHKLHKPILPLDHPFLRLYLTPSPSAHTLNPLLKTSSL
jgi:hypothetical protein